MIRNTPITIDEEKVLDQEEEELDGGNSLILMLI